MSKKPRPKEYKFKIDVFTPDTLPMERLGEYMTALARLLGEPSKVHFVELRKGSTVLVHKVETEAVPKIQERIDKVRKGDATKEETVPYITLNEMLKKDNGKGVLLGGGKGKILKFPGREEETKLAYGSIVQEGTIEGVPIWVGGSRKESARITIEEDGREFLCETTRETAIRIAPYLFTTPLRLIGRGRWQHDESGQWTLINFRISDFMPLKDSPLSEVVAMLRSVEGTELPNIEDPWAELRKLRHGNNGGS